VTIALDRSGVVGADGPTHHGVFDLSFLRFIPNLAIMAPKDENELQHMLYSCLHHDGPVVIRYPRGSGEGVALEADFSRLDFGRGELLRQGTDILLLPIGNRVTPALKAASRLETQGISAAVINPRFLKPLDEDLIVDWASTTGRIVTVEDNAVQGGFGSAVLQLLNQRGLFLPCSTLGYADNFIEHGPQSTLWRNAGIDADGIVQAAAALMGR
jgi:1-deoxy-D-xylulose-5-phosphate synthase